ncbi:unnamed protein product, partial [Brenthis ino]
MPLMRIRSVEIVFEDEISTYTDTNLLDHSIELIVSDSDDSTKCVDDLEQLHENEDSVTLNPEVDLSDDNSASNIDVPKCIENIQISEDSTAIDDTISINISEWCDSGRFTEEASSSHIEVPVLYSDAVLSNSYDAVNVDESIISVFEAEIDKKKLYEYIDSDSDSSDNTAVCDDTENLKTSDGNLEDTLCDANDLQYDSFVDIGKF